MVIWAPITSIIAGRILRMLGNSGPLKKRRVESGDYRFTEKLPAPAIGAIWDSQGRISTNGASINRAGDTHYWAIEVPAFAYSGMIYVTDANISIMAGALELPTGLVGGEHIFVASAGDYYEICDGLPQKAAD